MLAITPTEQADLERVYDAWRVAADEATDALHVWLSAADTARAATFAAYQAALDREEHAAWVLAHYWH